MENTRDEDLARRLQSQEFTSEGIDSFISLRQRIAQFKIDHLKNGTYISGPRRARENIEEDVIILDDDNENDSVDWRINSNRPSTTRNSQLHERIRTRRNGGISNTMATVNNTEETIRNDEQMARRLQAELDKEYEQSLQRRHLPTIQPRTNQHSDSLQYALQRLNNHSDNSSRQRTDRPRVPVIPPSFEHDMLNLVARNISSNELSSAEEERGPNLGHVDSLVLNRQNRILTNSRIISNRQYYRNLNLQFSSNPYQSNSGGYSRFVLEEPNTLQYRNTNSFEDLLRLDEKNVKLKLSKEEIESLTKFSYNTIKNVDSEADKTCSICFDDYTSRCSIIALVCSHKFHASCIKKWLNQSRRCPLCQKDAVNGT